MILWTGRRLLWVFRQIGRWYNQRPYYDKKLSMDERVKRLEYWVEVHHPLIPTVATPEEVKERGYWKGGEAT